MTVWEAYRRDVLAAQSTVERQTSYGGALGDVFRALKFLSISSGTTIIGRRNWTRHVFIAAALFALDTTACLSSPHTAQYVVEGLLICCSKPRLHGCTTGWTTGWMFVYTMQPVVQPAVQPDGQPVRKPAVSCIQTFNRLFNRLLNRLCGLTTEVEQPVESYK